MSSEQDSKPSPSAYHFGKYQKISFEIPAASVYAVNAPLSPFYTGPFGPFGPTPAPNPYAPIGPIGPIGPFAPKGPIGPFPT
jgi:hypothetical protein